MIFIIMMYFKSKAEIEVSCNEVSMFRLTISDWLKFVSLFYTNKMIKYKLPVLKVC